MIDALSVQYEYLAVFFSRLTACAWLLSYFCASIHRVCAYFSLCILFVPPVVAVAAAFLLFDFFSAPRTWWGKNAGKNPTWRNETTERKIQQFVSRTNLFSSNLYWRLFKAPFPFCEPRTIVWIRKCALFASKENLNGLFLISENNASRTISAASAEVTQLKAFRFSVDWRHLNQIYLPKLD